MENMKKIEKPKLMSKRDMQNYEHFLETSIDLNNNYPFNSQIREYLEYADEHPKIKRDSEFRSILNYTKKRQAEIEKMRRRGIICEEDIDLTQAMMMNEYFRKKKITIDI